MADQVPLHHQLQLLLGQQGQGRAQQAETQVAKGAQDRAWSEPSDPWAPPCSTNRGEGMERGQALTHLAGQNYFFRSPCSTTSFQNRGKLSSWSARRSRSKATAGSLRSFFTEVAAIFSTVTSLQRKAEGTQGALPEQTGPGAWGHLDTRPQAMAQTRGWKGSPEAQRAHLPAPLTPGDALI